MPFAAVHAPQSSAALMEAPRKVSFPRRLRFLGVEGFDVYNITTPFSCGGRMYIAGRVEKRENEMSFVRFLGTFKEVL